MQRERPACVREPLVQRWNTRVLGERPAQRCLEPGGFYVKEPAGGGVGHDRLGAEPLDQWARDASVDRPWTRESAADRDRLWAQCERLSGWPDIPASTHSNR